MTAASHPETEKPLLQIWSEVLNHSGIGIHDDFFSLGGDSLAAMRCMNRISATFGVELPLDLFLLKSASIAEVASEIARITVCSDHNQSE
jgi:yersiniabactin nonribosomal peptide synthetase